jgi:hypothetical protein
MPLATVANYKAWAGINGTGSDAAITLMLAQAEASVRRYAGRDMTNGFESANRTETYNGDGAAVLQLREWPVTTVTTVEERDRAGTWTTLDADEYRVDTRTGQLYRLGATWGRIVSDFVGGGNNPAFGVSPSWSADPASVRVTYTGGYTTIPADIVAVVYLLIDHKLANAGSDQTLTSESIGVYSKSRGGTYFSETDILAKNMPSELRGTVL